MVSLYIYRGSYTVQGKTNPSIQYKAYKSKYAFIQNAMRNTVYHTQE